MAKTANQLWKEYRKEGGTLEFRNWLDRENKKDFLNFTGDSNTPMNKPLTDSINQTINNLHKTAGYQDTFNKEYIFGIPKNVLIILGITAVGGTLIYLAYKYKGE